MLILKIFQISDGKYYVVLPIDNIDEITSHYLILDENIDIQYLDDGENVKLTFDYSLGEKIEKVLIDDLEFQCLRNFKGEYRFVEHPEQDENENDDTIDNDKDDVAGNIYTKALYYSQQTSTFITGPGNTGKSHFIWTLYNSIDQQQEPAAVLSTTYASCKSLERQPNNESNVKVDSIYKFFGIVEKIIESKTTQDEAVRVMILLINKNKTLLKNWTHYQTFIIDDIQLISYKYFDIVASIFITLNKKLPKFILVGDFSQGNRDHLYCFKSSYWNELFKNKSKQYFIFKKSFTCPQWSKQIYQLWFGDLTDLSEFSFNTNLNEDDRFIHLFVKASQVELFNKQKLKDCSESMVYTPFTILNCSTSHVEDTLMKKQKIIGKDEWQSYPKVKTQIYKAVKILLGNDNISDNIKFFVGEKVLVTTLQQVGEITRLNAKWIEVKFISGEKQRIKLFKETHKVKFSETEVLNFTIQYFPLKMVNAMSVLKSKGILYKYISLYLKENDRTTIFKDELFYNCLLRLQHPEYTIVHGLDLIESRFLLPNPQVLEFYSTIPEQVLNNEYDANRNPFYMEDNDVNENLNDTMMKLPPGYPIDGRKRKFIELGVSPVVVFQRTRYLNHLCGLRTQGMIKKKQEFLEKLNQRQESQQQQQQQAIEEEEEKVEEEVIEEPIMEVQEEPKEYNLSDIDIDEEQFNDDNFL